MTLNNVGNFELIFAVLDNFNTHQYLTFIYSDAFHTLFIKKKYFNLQS